MYSNTAAVLRPDVQTKVEEAAQADQMFIGERVFPVFNSPTKNGQYPKFKLATGELLAHDNKPRAPGSAYQRLQRAYETDTYDCQDRGLEEPVDDSVSRDVARFFDAEVAAANLTYRNVRIGHEVRVAAALMAPATFTATAAAVAYTEANIATIAFHRDILAAADRLNAKGIVPNAVVMNNLVFNRTRRSTLAQNFIRGAGRATDSTQLLNAADLAASLGDIGVNQVLVGRLSYNGAKKGQAFSATSVWGSTYIWVGRIEAGDFMNGGAGRSIVWTEEGGLFVTETYRDEEIRSDVVRVRQNMVEKVIDASAGELITTSYS